VGKLAAAAPNAEPEEAAVATAPAKKRKLSYKDQRELDSLPGQIEKLEQRQQELEKKVSQPDFYQGEHAQVEKTLGELTSVQAGLETIFERWAALEGEL